MTVKLILNDDTPPDRCGNIILIGTLRPLCQRPVGHSPTGHEAIAHSYGGTPIHLIWGRPEDDKPCDAASS